MRRKGLGSRRPHDVIGHAPHRISHVLVAALSVREQIEGNILLANLLSIRRSIRDSTNPE